MKNFWLDRFRIGKRVRYIGYNEELYMKCGYIIQISDSGWADVEFELIGFIAISRLYSVHKDELELI